MKIKGNIFKISLKAQFPLFVWMREWKMNDKEDKMREGTNLVIGVVH